MKFLPLILKNLLRKKTRSLLTVGSIAVALFLFGLLIAIETGINSGMGPVGANRLVVRNRISLIMPLPFSYQERIRRMPHVVEASFGSWFGGIYQERRNFFPQFAIDPESWMAIYPEFVIPDDEFKSFLADREGAVAGRSIADRYGWKVGDRIPLQGTIFPGTWEFNIRAIYDGAKPEDDTSQFWFHWKYLEERMKGMIGGHVGYYVIEIDDPDNAVEVARTIDQRFANSPYETSTETESAFAAGFAKQLGNIRLIILSIGSVVMFTLLLVTGNTMAMAVRERTSELGVLKSLGFSDTAVLFLVLTESVMLAVIGGGIGIGVFKLFTLGGDPTGGMMPAFRFPLENMAVGAALAVAVGLAAGAIPSFTAMRLKIVDALRRV